MQVKIKLKFMYTVASQALQGVLKTELFDTAYSECVYLA